jgi:predicted GNAT family acetyltransferase
MSQPTLKVINNTERGRYEAEVDGKIAFIEYRDAGGVRYYTHTEVPEELEGRGIASAMAKQVLDEAREQNLSIVPHCPFMRNYINRHPEYQSLVRF